MMRPKRPNRTHLYGDFPQLFWDARKDAPIDVTEPVTLARILTRADAKTVGQLVPRDVLEQQLDNVIIPEPARVFWRRVIAHLPPRTESNRGQL